MKIAYIIIFTFGGLLFFQVLLLHLQLISGILLMNHTSYPGSKIQEDSLIRFTLPNQVNLKHSALSVLSTRETITNHSPIICSFSSLSLASDKHPLTTLSIKTPFWKPGL